MSVPRRPRWGTRPVWLVLNGVQRPGLGQALEFVLALVGEGDAGAATRSTTVRETRTWAEAAWAQTLAARCRLLLPRRRHGLRPRLYEVRTHGDAEWAHRVSDSHTHRTARPGPSKLATNPSPVVLTHAPGIFRFGGARSRHGCRAASSTIDHQARRPGRSTRLCR